MTAKISLLFFFFLIVLTSCAFKQQRQLYYLVEQDFQTKPSHLIDLESNPENIPIQVINCKKQIRKCLKFKIAEPLPLLIFWGGPGTGFKSLGNPSLLTFNNFISKTKSLLIYPLRNFIQKLTFNEFMIMAVVVMQIFYMIFSALFKDRSGHSAMEVIHNKQKLQ